MSQPVPLQSLSGLPQFLRYLGTYPGPGQALTAMRDGPFARFGMFAGYLWRLVDDRELVSVATIGLTDEEASRYQTVPISLDLPAARAVREDVVLVDAAPTIGIDYLDSIDKDFWDRLLARTTAVSVLSAPIRHGDRAAGAFGFVTDRPFPEDERSRGLVAAVGAALSLWLTHPQTGIVGTPSPQRSGEWSLAFTDRQRAILRMVEEGRSNHGIARHLRVSESTVKQDLQQAMRALRARSRMAAAARARALGLM